MLDETARGVFTIACTPFTPDGDVDWDSVDRMVDFYADRGATGLTILGIMGEAPKLTAAEAEAVVTRVTARTDLPVIVGVTAPGLAAMSDLARKSVDAGAAGVMVAPAAGLRTDAAIASHFALVAEALGDIPWVLQDFPLVTGVTIPAPLIARIVHDCPNCVMLKHEDWPGLDKITALRASEATGARRISILCGNGGLYLPQEMARGADGAMTGFAFPEMMADVVAAHAAGAPERALDLYDAYLPMLSYENQPGLGLAIRKHVLARRGAIAHATLRRPTGPALSPETVAEIDRLILRQDAALARLG